MYKAAAVVLILIIQFISILHDSLIHTYEYFLLSQVENT